MHSESALEATLQTTDPSTTTYSTLDDTSDNTLSGGGKLNVTRDDLERRQLLHNLQLLKLEVSQKNLVIDTLKADHAAQLEDLQERLSDSLHEKQLAQARLKSLSQAHDAELRRVRERSQQETSVLAARMKELEEANPFVGGQEQDIKQALTGPGLSELEYSRLRAKDSDSLSLKDYIMVHIYEHLQPLHKDCRALADHVQELTEDLSSARLEHGSCGESLAVKDEQVARLETRCSQLSRELSHVHSQVEQGNYRIEHFDAMIRERDALQTEVDTLKRAMQEMESGVQISKDRESAVRKELLEEGHTVTLLRQDKEYLGRQVNELTGQCAHLEERCGLLSRQLDEAKMAKEKTLEHVLKAKEDYKREYEIRAQQELDSLRLRMNQEMEQLRNQSRDTFGHENRTLQEARDNACAERDRALAAEREMNSKYDQLVHEFRQLQMSSDGRSSALQGELQMKRFELERAHTFQEQTLKDLRHCELEREKLHKKAEVLSQELWAVQNEGKVRVLELEARVREQGERLEVYEKVERELDQVVMQAAEVESDVDAERVLFSYGFGASVPSTSKRRMQQSVQLARRVLQLERMNACLRKDEEAMKSKIDQLDEELSQSKALLGKSHQPYVYLIESIKMRDEQLKAAKIKVMSLEGQLSKLTSEKAHLLQAKNSLAADLEKLLKHREDLKVMKRLILELHGEALPPQERCDVEEGHKAPPPSLPAPTVFTKHEHSRWPKRLDQQGKAAASSKTNFRAS